MSWFECKVSYEKDTNGNGNIKSVKEVFLVDSESFTDAEVTIAEILSKSGPYIIEGVKRVKYQENFLNDKHKKYYKVKVAFISLDEKNGVEKYQYYNVLLESTDVESAVVQIKEEYKDNISNFDIISINELPYVDVILR